MKRFLLPLGALALISVASAQGQPLTIGDPAPAFKVTGWSKGTPVDDLKEGNVYVVEFWATWCGPCIASMPHLSDMADKFAGKATLISVNTWDYKKVEEGKENDVDHVSRVNAWVKENDAKMRYNVAFDDASDTMANTWMRAAGRNGIPCAFIVDKEKRIAWIGHPMQMEDPLKQVVDGTWDRNAFKEKFVVEQQKAIAAMENSKKLSEAAKAGNVAEFEALMAKTGAGPAISSAIGANPDFAMGILEKQFGNTTDLNGYVWCSMAAAVAQRTKSDEVKARAVKFSEMAFGKVEAKEAALGAIMHARCLFYSGDKEKANEWAARASTLIDSFEPAAERDAVKKFIEDTRGSFSASNTGKK